MNKQSLETVKDCRYPWTWMVVASDGRVMPCCYAVRELGNLNEDSAEGIWNGRKAQELRAFIKRDQIHPVCSGAVCKFVQNSMASAKEPGSELTALTLWAPPAGIIAAGWHEVEQSPAGPFRWTSSSRVVWRSPADVSDNLEIRIPWRQTISADFLEDCAVFIEGRKAEVTLQGFTLIARVSGLPPLRGVSAELKTPEPKTPRSIHGSADERPLGLAVAVM